ncbi:terminase small subunit [Herbiconiux solani]|uniref:terminase small subunit n=1 Tax=Herbiconiux solani TaxID=661329 RepID=UPI0012EDDCCB|nr:hypothetical protein [Herbiconiux solani]
MPTSEDERRARDAERKRRRRAEQRAEAAAVKATGRVGADTPDTSAPTTMRDEVEAAIAAMKWLVESDRASKAQARMLAEDVDLLRHAGETTKALSAQRALSRVLADLGGTPTVRMQHELRSLRATTKSEGSDGEGSSEGGSSAGGNVTALRRPEKRAR